MVSPEFPPQCGGIGWHVKSLCDRLARNGYNVTVLTRGRWRERIRRDVGLPYDVLRLEHFPSYPFHLFLHQTRLVSYLHSKDVEYDLIHIHHPLSPPIKVSRTPCVLTLHGFAWRHPSDRRSHFARIALGLVLGHLESSLVGAAREVAVVSRSCIREINHEQWREKMRFVGNGVDTDFFSPRMRAPEDYSFTYTGPLVPIKGLLTLVEAAGLLSRREPVSFNLVGEGPMKKVLETLVSKSNLRPHFRFLGRLGREDVKNVLQGSYGFVLPSFYEGMPTSLLEAMSCQLPCIASAVGGIPELATNEKNALLIPPGKPAHLARAIQTILNDRRIGLRIAEKAREHVRRWFDWDVVFRRYLRVYSLAGD